MTTREDLVIQKSSMVIEKSSLVKSIITVSVKEANSVEEA